MPETIVSAMLRRTSIFGDLALAERLALAGAFRRRDVAADTYLVRAGDPGRSFFLVTAGRIGIGLTGPRGRRVTLAELGPGDYFGELSLIDGSPRSANAVALQGSELMELPQEEFFRLIDKHPAIARRLLVELCRRLRDADRQIGALVTVDAAGRIVRALRYLAARHARDEGGHLVFAKAPRQQEIATLAGTTRATTSRVFRQLVKRGVLSVSGSLLILHDRAAISDDNLR